MLRCIIWRLSWMILHIPVAPCSPLWTALVERDLRPPI